MAKGRGDVILRDRLQFELDASGDRTTVYGRMDLSQYTSGRNGLAIKEVRFMLRDPTSTSAPNTGNWSVVGQGDVAASSYKRAYYKLFASTRAYENAADVGIASPDVLCVQTGEWAVGTFEAGAGTQSNAVWYEERWNGPEDLHPEDYMIVTDLLIGIALDGWETDAAQTIELDVLLVADEVTVTTERLNELLAQAQDL